MKSDDTTHLAAFKLPLFVHFIDSLPVQAHEHRNLIRCHRDGQVIRCGSRSNTQNGIRLRGKEG